MKRSVLFACIAVVTVSFFASACSGTPKVEPSNHSRASSTGALALAERKSGGSGAEFASVRFVDRAGKEIRTFTLPPGATSPTVGGDRIFFVVDGEVHSVGTTGPSANHGRFMEKGLAFYDIVVSPDGKRWAWRVDDVRRGRATFDSQIFFAGIGQKKKLLVEQKGQDRVLTPMLWTNAGLVVVDMEVGIGGLIFFSDTYWGISTLVDPDSGRNEPLTAFADECPLNDVSSDGSWTCLSGLGHGGGSVSSPAKATVMLHKTGTSVIQLAIEQKAIQAGNGIISPDGGRVAVGIFTGVSGEVYHRNTIVFDVGSGTQRIVTFDSSRPVAWLPDNSLVLATDESDGASRISLLMTDGATVAVGDGEFLGYVSTAGSISSR